LQAGPDFWNWNYVLNRILSWLLPQCANKCFYNLGSDLLNMIRQMWNEWIKWIKENMYNVTAMCRSKPAWIMMSVNSLCHRHVVCVNLLVMIHWWSESGKGNSHIWYFRKSVFIVWTHFLGKFLSLLLVHGQINLKKPGSV